MFIVVEKMCLAPTYSARDPDAPITAHSQIGPPAPPHPPRIPRCHHPQLPSTTAIDEEKISGFGVSGVRGDDP